MTTRKKRSKSSPVLVPYVSPDGSVIQVPLAEVTEALAKQFAAMANQVDDEELRHVGQTGSAKLAQKSASAIAFEAAREDANRRRASDREQRKADLDKQVADAIAQRTKNGKPKRGSVKDVARKQEAAGTPFNRTLNLRKAPRGKKSRA